MLKIEPGKEYRTRDGQRVRIYATDGGNLFPVHGAYKPDNEIGWKPEVWAEDGKWDSGDVETGLDLVEEWKEVMSGEVWLSVCISGDGIEHPFHSIYSSEKNLEDGVQFQKEGNILIKELARLKINWKEGDGLNGVIG